jgi:hypothetical protein
MLCLRLKPEACRLIEEAFSGWHRHLACAGFAIAGAQVVIVCAYKTTQAECLCHTNRTRRGLLLT